MGERIPQTKHSIECRTSELGSQFPKPSLFEADGYSSALRVLMGTFHHAAAQVCACQGETCLRQRDGMHTRPAGGIQHVVCSGFFQLTLQERHFHCQTICPIDKAVVICAEGIV